MTTPKVFIRDLIFRLDYNKSAMEDTIYINIDHMLFIGFDYKKNDLRCIGNDKSNFLKCGIDSLYKKEAGWSYAIIDGVDLV